MLSHGKELLALILHGHTVFFYLHNKMIRTTIILMIMMMIMIMVTNQPCLMYAASLSIAPLQLIQGLPGSRAHCPGRYANSLCATESARKHYR